VGRALRCGAPRVPLDGADADAPLAELLARCEALSQGGFSDAATTPDALRARTTDDDLHRLCSAE
jgi:hypothetical protein